VSYANGFTAVYRLENVAVDGAAVIDAIIIGPAGLDGRLIDIMTTVISATTVAVAAITVGDATVTDEYGVLTQAVASADAIQNGMTRGDSEIIPADSLVEIGNDGGATAGDVDIVVMIEWY